MKITKQDAPCGAVVSDIDLSQPLSETQVSALRKTWLDHHVLIFPNQNLSDDDLERFTLNFGPFGDDPFIEPIKGRKHVIAVCRAAGETTPIFADAWHTDWSFQDNPPAGTCLYGITIPPHGGDTLFANQHLALEEMPRELRSKIEGLRAVHSATLAYGAQGVYGESDKEAGRSMDIRTSEEADATRKHSLIRAHPETGREAIYGTIGYVIGYDDLPMEKAAPLLMELHEWQTQDRFVYRHKWEPGMLGMWDNRSVLHKATGGYEGHERRLHRTTIGATV